MKKIALYLACMACFSLALAQQNTSLTLSPDSSQMTVKLLPNPAQQHVLLTFSNPDQERFHLYVIDLNGRVVRTYGDIYQEKIKLDVSGLSKGLYLFELRGKQSFYGRLMLR